MKRNEKNLFSKAGVLLLAAVMVLSIIPAVTADSDTDTGPFYELAGEYNPYQPEKPYPVRLTGERIPYAGNNPSFSLGGGVGSDAVLAYTDGYTENSIQWTDGSPWTIAVQFTDLELATYRDYQIDEINVSIGCDAYTFEISDYTIYIEPALGDILFMSPVATGTSAGLGWEVIPITPTDIPDTGDVFVIITFSDYTQFPAGLDQTVTSPLYGGWMLDTLTTDVWTTITALGYPGVWGVKVGVSESTGPGPSGECIPDACDFEIVALNQAYMYDGKINELPQIVNISIINNGEVGINEVKILVDIYKKICGPTSTLYCDEKFDIRFWEEETDGIFIVDDDGDGDSWVLQGGAENRWLTNNQAWRNTLGKYRSAGGDVDTYLGLDDDAEGYDNLTFAPEDNDLNDISGAACATFTFSHWAEGEYTFSPAGFLIPVDYGYMSYRIDDGSGTVPWTEVNVSDFIAYDTDGEWEDVTIKFLNTDIFIDTSYAEVCDTCDVGEDDIMVVADFPDDAFLEIRFTWVKDPCYNFEGWYVDNLCITRTETYELELVHQTHVITSLPGCDPEFGPQPKFIEFPIGWDPEPDTWYYIEICGQVFSPNDCEFTTENNCIDLQFYVTDIHDLLCKEMNIITPPPYRQGDTILVNMTVRNEGTFAEDNVPVELSIADCILTEHIDDDMETDPTGRWTNYYFTGREPNALFYWSEGDPSISDIYEIDEAAARSVLPGSESFVCAYPGSEFTYPYMTENQGQLLTDDVVYDFSDALDASLSFYYKYSLDDNGADGACLFVHPVSGPDSAYWWIVNYGAWRESPGYQNDWAFVDVDLLGLATSFGYDDAGDFVIPGVEIGWGLLTYIDDGSAANDANPVPWSGLMLDRIELDIVTCGGTETVVDTVYTGAIAPGDEETLQLSWSDAEYCSHCLIVDVQLDGDVDTSNDDCQECILVSNVTDIGDYASFDLTGQGDCLWHICNTRGGGDDNYAWAGIEEPTWAHYIDNMDDSLISPMINLTDYSADGVYINITHWYEFNGTSVDFGEVYIRNASTEPWFRVAKIAGNSGGFFVNLVKFIDGKYCSETTQIKFRMKSDGEGVSEGWYIADVCINENIPAPPSFTPGDMLWSFPIDPATGDNQNLGIEALNDEIWVTGGNNGVEPNKLSRLDLGGNLLNQYDQASLAGWGWRDLAYDGTYLYASDSSVVQEIDPVTGLATGSSFPSPVSPARALAYDPATDHFWTSSFGGNIFEFDRTGFVYNSFADPAGGSYGAAWDDQSPDGPWLWMHDQYGIGGKFILQFDPVAGVYTGLGYDGPVGDMAGGACIYEIGGLAQFIGLAQMDPDQAFGVEIAPATGGGGGTEGPSIWCEDWEDDNDIAPWTCIRTAAGDYWKHYTTSAGYLPDGVTADFNGDDDWWVVHGYPSTGPGLNDLIYTQIDLSDETLSNAAIDFGIAFNIETPSEMFIEISEDFDGTNMLDSTWIPFWHQQGGFSDGWLTTSDLVTDNRFELNQYLGQVIYLRFRYTTPGEGMGLTADHGWAVDGLTLAFKAAGDQFSDDEAPVTSIFFNQDTAQVTLIAEDYPINKGCGVKATYYKIDGGAETTYTGAFSIGEGTHTVAYWSEDNCGNTENQKSATFTVDTSNPTVTLTSPEDGKIYLLGNALMNRILGTGTLCIGKIPVAADANDGTGSGVAMVMFSFDNGDTGFDDDGSNGFTYTWRGMHFGALTISAVAIDGVGLTSSPDSMTVTVYSLGLL